MHVKRCTKIGKIILSFIFYPIYFFCNDNHQMGPWWFSFSHPFPMIYLVTDKTKLHLCCLKCCGKKFIELKKKIKFFKNASWKISKNKWEKQGNIGQKILENEVIFRMANRCHLVNFFLKILDFLNKTGSTKLCSSTFYICGIRQNGIKFFVLRKRWTAHKCMSPHSYSHK